MQAADGASLTATPGTTAAGGRRRVGVLLTVAAVVVVLDQVTKLLAVHYLDDGRVVEVAGELLRLRLIRNPGAAFSIGGGYTIVLSLVAVTVILVVLRISRRLRNTAWAVALGGLLGGAMGNLLDRLFRAPAPLRGHVVDFLQLPHWPVFNVADSTIVGAAVLMVVLSLRGSEYDQPAGR